MDTVNVKAVEIQAIIQKVVSRIQYIDVFINGLEVIVEKDLQRTMNVNMQVYLTFVMLVRDIMDRTKGGHGGVIVNLLSNMGMQVFGVKNYNVDVVHNVQQYLINKQMLLSFSKTVSQEWFYQQTGVKVVCVFPVINQNMIVRNINWIKKIGLQNLVVDMNIVGGRSNVVNTIGGVFDVNNVDVGVVDDCVDVDVFGFNTVDTDVYDVENVYKNRNSVDHYHHVYNDDYYNVHNKGHVVGDYSNVVRVFDVLGVNVVRVIESSQNGSLYVVGVQGVKAVEHQGVVSRL